MACSDASARVCKALNRNHHGFKHSVGMLLLSMCGLFWPFVSTAQTPHAVFKNNDVSSLRESKSDPGSSGRGLAIRFENGLNKVEGAVERFLNGDWLHATEQVQKPLVKDAHDGPSAEEPQQSSSSPLSTSAEFEDVEFDTAFLGQQPHIDLSKFSNTNHVQPGILRVDIHVNSVLSYTDFVRFDPDDQGHGRPCLTGKQVLRAGIRNLGSLSEHGCSTISNWVPGASYQFDQAAQTLNLIIPQAYVQPGERHAVDPNLWETGIPVLHSQYSFAGSHSDVKNVQNRSFFGRFDNTLSAFGWQFKNGMTVSHSPKTGWNNQVLNAYLRTDVEQLQGELKFGEIYTSGVMFDTFNLKGATLTSYDEFLSDQHLGYAPVVRGVAETNATVTITQNGVQIYKVNVPPGPFEISDLRGAGYSGTLLVSVAEANGLVKTFLTPYSAQAQMVRKGRLKYALNAGQYNASGIVYRPDVAQATFQYGLFSNLTIYGGANHSQRYASVLRGVALNSFLGTVSFDHTRSRADLDRGLQEGFRQRWTFNKSIESTGMMMNVSHESHGGNGYLSLNSAVSSLSYPNEISGNSNRAQWMISLSQPLGYFGDMSLSWVKSNFNRSPLSDSYGMTWRKSFNRLNFSVSANHQLASMTHSPFNSASKTISFHLSMPLDQSGFFSSGVNFSNNRPNSQTTYSNSFGERKQFGFNTTLNTDTEHKASVSTSASMRSDIGYQSLGMSVSTGYRNISFGMSGGAALHSGGVTWAPQISDTMALVHAPGAEGARVNGDYGPRVDRHGYAIVSNLQAYRVNEIYLDPRGISQDVELTTTSQQAIVRSGGVVRLKYATVSGRGLIMTLSRDQAGTVPFGATVMNDKGQDVGAVGQGSRVFLRGIPPNGRLIVSWGGSPNDSCEVEYSVPLPDDRRPYDFVTVQCNSPSTNFSSSNPAIQ